MNDKTKSEEVDPVPDGWSLQSHMNTFSGHAGPFYFRDDRSKSGVGFFSKPHHANAGGVIHGGVLMTLADMSLFDICFREHGMFNAVTVTLNSEFLAPGPVGEFIEASGDLVKSGKRMLFARGLITAKGKPLLAFSGSLSRIKS